MDCMGASVLHGSTRTLLYGQAQSYVAMAAA
jgi:hypothetical protein